MPLIYGTIEKDKTISAPKNNGTIAVTLDFSKADRCWFNLRSDDTRNNLGVNSPHQWKFQADEKNTVGRLSLFQRLRVIIDAFLVDYSKSP